MNRHAKLWLLPMALVIAGCSSMKPAPEGMPALKSAYERDRSLPNAVAYAESLRDAYLARSGDMRVEERVNGLALIGIGMITGDLVARGVGKSEVLGLGLAGVGLYSANNWANPKTERLIYAETGAAVHCAIAVIDPLRPAYEKLTALQTGMGQLISDSKSLDGTLSGFVGSDEPRVVRARNAVSKARAAASAAEIALGYLKAAGPSLMTAVGGMRADVEVQLVRGGPDYNALVSSLVQQKVLPAAAPLAMPDGKKEAGSATTLEAPTAALEDKTSAVEKLVAMSNVRPSAADLQRCRVDPKAAGITMRVEPAVISLKAGDKAVALASGGVLPYTAIPVLDATAADQITLTVAGNGVITIEAKPAAKSTTFTAIVTDAGKGRETMTVTVIAVPAPVETDATKPGKNTSTTPVAACSKPDPAIKELQEGLRALGITKVKVDDGEKDLVVDSCAGKITTAAAKQFYISQGMTDADIEKDEAALMKQAASDVKEAVKKKQASK